jgi:vitamin B12 transporter
MKITLNNPHRNHFFGYVTAAVCLSAPLVSQPSLTADSEQLQEIPVSASLLPIAGSRSASAVTVIDREQLKNRLALDVSDLLRDVPSISVSRSGVMGSQTQVRMRGAEANHVLVLIDGIEANDPSLRDETSWASLSAADVQRIEVLRGPQSALYGSDAMAGVISIETTRASQGSTAQLFSEAGSFSTHRSGVAVGHAARDYNIRMSASHLETDGDNIARSGDEKDGYRNTTIN